MFYVMSTTIILIIAYVCKTRSAQIFGYLVTASVLVYMVAGRKFLKDQGIL